MSDTPHPSESMLIAFGEGRLDDADIESVGDHLESCEQCQRLIEEIERRVSSLVARLRGVEGTLDRLPADYEQKLLAIRVPVDGTVIGPVHNEAGRDTGTYAESVDTKTSHIPTTWEMPKEFGRYRVKKLLGQGAMGAVYLAQDTQLDRPVALKIPKFDQQKEAKLSERFYREARAVATIHHPNICPVFDVGEIEGQIFLSMAFIKGRPLSDFTKSDKKQGQRSVAKLVMKLAKALQEAHNIGVVHRDLKPANIMVSNAGLITVRFECIVPFWQVFVEVDR